MWKDTFIHLVGPDRIFAEKQDEGEGGSSTREYRLWDWETGEHLYSFAAKNDSVFCCIGSDGAAAFSIEDICKDSFTLVRMDLSDGTSSSRVIKAEADFSHITAASDGRRVILDFSHRLRIAVEEEKEPVTAINTDIYIGLFLPAFSPDGNYVVSCFAFPGKNFGEGIDINVADAFFSNGSRVEKLYHTGGAFDCISDISAENFVSAVSTRGKAFIFFPIKGQKDLFRAQCGRSVSV